METEPPHAGEYAAILQKMLTENETAAEAVRVAGRQDLAEALVEREAAREHLQGIQANRDRYLAEYTEQHRRELLGQMRRSMQETLAQELLEAGEDEVEALLDLPKREIDDIRMRIGQRKLGKQFAWVEYESAGRGGYVTFRRGKTRCRFWHDLGAGKALMVIEVPDEARWETETSIPLAEREAVLRFIGEDTILHQAPGHLFRIDSNSIVILAPF
ncbi:MAG: hypothetical protein IT260_17085 [Saprospiraceae bacterium]|nr:hypothetical protein [Saprospiraceae bacterium]